MAGGSGRNGDLCEILRQTCQVVCLPFLSEIFCKKLKTLRPVFRYNRQKRLKWAAKPSQNSRKIPCKAENHAGPDHKEGRQIILIGKNNYQR